MSETSRPGGTEGQIAQRMNQRPPSLEVEPSFEGFQEILHHLHETVGKLREAGFDKSSQFGRIANMSDQDKAAWTQLADQEIAHQMAQVAARYDDPYLEKAYPFQEAGPDVAVPEWASDANGELRYGEDYFYTDRVSTFHAGLEEDAYRVMDFIPLAKKDNQEIQKCFLDPERTPSSRISWTMDGSPGKEEREYKLLDNWIAYVDVPKRPMLLYLEQYFKDLEMRYSVDEPYEGESMKSEADWRKFAQDVRLYKDFLYKIGDLLRHPDKTKEQLPDFKSFEERYEEYKKAKSEE